MRLIKRGILRLMLQLESRNKVPVHSSKVRKYFMESEPEYYKSYGSLRRNICMNLLELYANGYLERVRFDGRTYSYNLTDLGYKTALEIL